MNGVDHDDGDHDHDNNENETKKKRKEREGKIIFVVETNFLKKTTTKTKKQLILILRVFQGFQVYRFLITNQDFNT